MASPVTVAGSMAIVVIGRNEGQRLERALDAAQGRAEAVIYVDSASSDGSPELAATRVDRVVALDPSEPLSAARARNAGFAAAAELLPDLALVQFVDGDCVLDPDWLAAACAWLAAHPQYGGVCGRRRELRPKSSIWSRALDLEWDVGPGPADTFAADALVHAEAFRTVGGYDETLIAGEDPDFAARMRKVGSPIERIAAEMTRHDASGLRYGQWWIRQVRAGHALAEAWQRGGRPLSGAECRQVVSAALWGGALPLSIVATLGLFGGAGAVLSIAYGILAVRIFGRERQRRGNAQAALWACICMLAKFPACQGLVLYAWRRGRPPATALIEYK